MNELTDLREYLGEFPEHDQADYRVFAAYEAFEHLLQECEALLRVVRAVGTLVYCSHEDPDNLLDAEIELIKQYDRLPEHLRKGENNA